MTLEQETRRILTFARSVELRILTFARSVELQAETLAAQMDVLKAEAVWLHSFAVSLADKTRKIEQAELAVTMADELRRCTGSVSVTYDDGRGNVAVSQAK